jgi:dihydrodipicolinate synthase/N-acetylneuraminate lyase
MHFRGIYAPLTTPFDHRGSIYWSKVDYNLAQLRRTKLSGIVVTDKWGEGPLLSPKERVAIWKRAVAEAAGGADILATISGCGVSVARESVAIAAEIGCSAAILEAPDLSELAPRASPASLFFRAVADTASLPLLASVRLGGLRGISSKMLADLAMHPRIVGAIVEDTPVQTVVTAAKACRRDFAIAVRDLECTAPCLATGASAAVLALAAVVPFYALSIEEAVRTREHAAAASLAERGLDFARLLKAYGVPALKCALDLRSFYGGIPRLPLLGVPPDTAEAISLSLQELAS